MPVRNTATEGKAAMFCSTDGIAFGPVFDSEYELDDFIEYANENESRDLRALGSADLESLLTAWRGQRARETSNGGMARG